MGLFHCPTGAISRGDTDCIDCKLCMATTPEERIEASKVIRKWVETEGKNKYRDIYIKKIAVCGKGGSGKSSISALLAGALEALGYATVVMDSDASNGGMWKKLGMKETAKALNLIDETKPENAWFEASPMVTANFCEPYIQNNGFRSLITAGKITESLEGDSNEINNYSKEVIRHLQLLDKEVLIVDQDAGVESFGRGTEILIDTVLIPVEPSEESIELAGRIQYLAKGLGIKRIRAIITKTENPEDEEFIKDRLEDMEIRYLGTLNANRELQKRNLRGIEYDPEFSYKYAGEITRMMLDEAQMPYKRPDCI